MINFQGVLDLEEDVVAASWTVVGDRLARWRAGFDVQADSVVGPECTCLGCCRALSGRTPRPSPNRLVVCPMVVTVNSPRRRSTNSIVLQIVKTMPCGDDPVAVDQRSVALAIAHTTSWDRNVRRRQLRVERQYRTVE